MSVDEIFTALASRMIKGMMLHEQLMNTYLFLGLSGFAKCHEYHYISETKNYIKLNKYKVEHYGSLVKQGPFEIPDIIPESWFSFTKDDVEKATRKQAIAAAIEEWLMWETGSREAYVRAYNELISLQEVATAEFIKEFILDVEDEIVYASNDKVHKSSIDYDIVSIIEEQLSLEKFFDKKIRKL